MRYSTIYKCDISDGPGTRIGLYTQGCYHKCEKCFNKHTWDFKGGKELTEEVIKKIFELCRKDYISGLSIVGGDPLCLFDTEYLESIGIESDYRKPLVNIITKFKELYPNKTIWLWTGYLWEELVEYDKDLSIFQKNISEILPYIDVIVDGPFMEEYKVLNLKYRGSTNQRIIDVKKSLENREVVIYQE